MPRGRFVPWKFLTRGQKSRGGGSSYGRRRSYGGYRRRSYRRY